MEKKLFVGSLSYSTTEDRLRDAFAAAGSVESVAIIFDRATNRSKGFGFVEMASPEEAQAAIKMWDGQDLDGRRLAVSVARPLKPRA
jgi:RNA recognition motif-containing protein